MHFQDPAAFGAAQQIDPNSPDMFKNNMHLAQQHILRIQQLAQSAIEAMCFTNCLLKGFLLKYHLTKW